VGQRAQVTARHAPEHPDEFLPAEVGDLAHREDPLARSFAGSPPDDPERLDRKRMRNGTRSNVRDY
jgi:hypothetical protein